ncbi:ribonuclease III [Rubidibacter lacunae KORDI 51-2]|uniref:Ribonuclease 3 n=1 Tax=Rubidibacter lacunae KORDI 51-2 TaxID=582515 RepID=U5D8L7_9CHRO|nr:ribonuclease III [Rubidibacter lacunae]ERN40953.1 ribonuclease III [Rubidibacter lacunae KORDI 51-2]
MTVPQPRLQHLQCLTLKLGLPADAPIAWELLDRALTHPSASCVNYQQLEFLGDSVLRLAASELLQEMYPDGTVGEFAALRSILVSDRVLAELADGLGLERYLLMSTGAAGDPAGRRSRLADAFEAVLGALYASTHSFDLVRPWLDPLLVPRADDIRRDPALYNYKDALQEWTQAQHKSLPEYRVRAAKVATDPSSRFTAEVWFRGNCLGIGTGPSKKAAEQAAAKAAYTTAVVADTQSSGAERPDTQHS